LIKNEQKLERKNIFLNQNVTATASNA